MALITYENKVALNENPSIANINKITDDDMNEIKSVVNKNTPVGSITMFTGSSAPTGWLICDGSAISRTTYANLFAIIGTTYGTGDGSTTFNIPNLKGRVPVGFDSSQTEFDALGETGGSKYLQQHIHMVTGGYGGTLGTNDNSDRPASMKNSTGTRSVAGFATSQPKPSYGQTMQTGDSGNLQPYIVLNYIIAY